MFSVGFGEGIVQTITLDNFVKTSDNVCNMFVLS